MKKNKKGFTLLETLIVSTFIAGTLVYLFVQLNNVKTNYDKTFRYNTVPGMYGAQNIITYLNTITFDDLTTKLETDLYVDITNGSSLLNGNSNYYNDLIKKIGAKTVIFTKDNVTELIESLDENISFDEEFKQYIKRIEISDIEVLYRVIIEYEDNTFATIRIENR